MKKLQVTQNDFSLVKEGIEAVAVQESTGQVCLFDYYYFSGYGYGGSSWSGSSSESSTEGYWVWAEHDFIIENSTTSIHKNYQYNGASSAAQVQDITIVGSYLHAQIDDYQVYVDGSGVHWDQTRDYGDFEKDLETIYLGYTANINGHQYSGVYKEIKEINLENNTVIFHEILDDIDPLNVLDGYEL